MGGAANKCGYQSSHRAACSGDACQQGDPIADFKDTIAVCYLQRQASLSVQCAKQKNTDQTDEQSLSRVHIHARAMHIDSECAYWHGSKPSSMAILWPFLYFCTMEIRVVMCSYILG